MGPQARPKIEHPELASKDPTATRRFLENAFGGKFTILEEMDGYSLHGRHEMPWNRDRGPGPDGTGARGTNLLRHRSQHRAVD